MSYPPDISRLDEVAGWSRERADVISVAQVNAVIAATRRSQPWSIVRSILAEGNPRCASERATARSCTKVGATHWSWRNPCAGGPRAA